MPERLPPEDYDNERRFYVETYLVSIREYDRLVTWGAGGALLLSITVVEKIAAKPVQSGYLLGASWLLLCLALATSLSSQYTSSHTQAAERAALDETNSASPNEGKWRKYDADCRRWGRWTRALTVASGVLLVLGVGALAGFALLNLLREARP
jgi:hypothetical protein